MVFQYRYCKPPASAFYRINTNKTSLVWLLVWLFKESYCKPSLYPFSKNHHFAETTNRHQSQWRSVLSTTKISRVVPLKYCRHFGRSFSCPSPPRSNTVMEVFLYCKDSTWKPSNGVLVAWKLRWAIIPTKGDPVFSMEQWISGNEKHQTSPNETRMIVALLWLWLWKPNVQKSKRNSLKAPSPSSYHLPQLQLLQNSALSCRFQPHHEHFHLRWAVDFVAHPGQAIPELRDSISHGSHHGRSRWQSTTLASFPKKKTSKKSQVTSLVLFFHHTSSNAALVFLEIGKMVPQNLKKWLRSMFIHSEVAAG